MLNVSETAPKLAGRPGKVALRKLTVKESVGFIIWNGKRGAEANRDGPFDEKGTYSFQRQLVEDHLAVYDSKPFVNGALVWALRDFRVRPEWDGGNPKPMSPLNQKGMRASIKMQALQPEMKALQDQFKDDPQAMQAEVFKLYKKHNVNPFSGCWPMLLPWPILLALFFVFQNTIELRGQPFLWLPDLSLKDPLFILPVLMGLSLFAVSKVGMIGVPPNPQMKTMLYVMPVMMTVLFFNFASGLNLYYFVQNVVSVPQQWMLAKERLKNQPPPAPPPEVKVKKKA